MWNYLGHSYQGVELFRAQLSRCGIIWGTVIKVWNYLGHRVIKVWNYLGHRVIKVWNYLGHSYQGVELFRAQLSRCGII